jgi:hypothetical protein
MFSDKISLIQSTVNGTWTLQKGTYFNNRQDYLFEQGNLFGPYETRNGISVGVQFVCAAVGSLKKGDQISQLFFDNWTAGNSLGFGLAGDGSSQSVPIVRANMCAGRSYSSRCRMGATFFSVTQIMWADCILTT